MHPAFRILNLCLKRQCDRRRLCKILCYLFAAYGDFLKHHISTKIAGCDSECRNHFQPVQAAEFIALCSVSNALLSRIHQDFRRTSTKTLVMKGNTLTEFLRAAPGWDARQGTLSKIAPDHAKPLKPESINVPPRGLDPLSRDGANVRNALPVAALDGRHGGNQVNENVDPSVVIRLV